MLRPSVYLAKLEDKLAEKLGPWFERHKAKFPVYIPLGLLGWYFYGMFLNSIRLGTAATFHTEGEEVGEFLELGPASEVKGMMLGKWKKRPDDPDKYAAYVAHRMVAGDNNNLLCIGAPGSSKSRGFIIPFMLGCAQRGESIFITDPKAELWEKMSPYFKDHGYCVRAVNFLDMAHSDGWNCLYSLDKET